MAERIRQQAETKGYARVIKRYTSMADEARDAADVLRNRLTTLPSHLGTRDEN